MSTDWATRGWRITWIGNVSVEAHVFSVFSTMQENWGNSCILFWTKHNMLPAVLRLKNMLAQDHHLPDSRNWNYIECSKIDYCYNTCLIFRQFASKKHHPLCYWLVSNNILSKICPKFKVSPPSLVQYDNMCQPKVCSQELWVYLVWPQSSTWAIPNWKTSKRKICSSQ